MSYFSQEHSDSVFNVKIREQKGRKILSVLEDYFGNRLDARSLLDIGCSSGIISNVLSHRLAVVAGIDIDAPAITYAKNNYSHDKMQFSIQDASSLAFPDQSFDVVVCSHIYEHVPDPTKLMSEIYRVLRPEGVCYFAAENRLRVMEPHYRLPLLSIIPRAVAHLYLRMLGRGFFIMKSHLLYLGCGVS